MIYHSESDWREDSYEGEDQDIVDDYLEPILSQDEEDERDDYINSRGGIDKCMCCGRYKYNDELSYPGQTCVKGCVNPNEY